MGSCNLASTMAKSTVTNAPRNVQNSDKNSSYTCTTVFVALLAIGGAYLYLDRTTTLNRFSEVFCDTLSAQAQEQRNVEKAETETSTPEPCCKSKLTRGSSNDPKLAAGESYNAKDALDARYHKLRDVCNEYADVMRAESLMKDQMPKKDNFVYDVNSWIAFCNLDGIGKKGFEGLMQRLQRGDNNNDSPIRQGLKNNFAGTHKRFKKALMVRHPMERILSVYRKTFAAYYDVDSKTDVSEEVTFPDFVNLIVNGPKELAEYIDQNQLEGQSLGIDTGMVDAKGQSAKWDSYWHRCGLCNPGFKPHYILHYEHYQKDEEVLVELLGNNEQLLQEAKEWLNIKHNHAITDEIIEHFYSQLTKEEIRGIYTKYRIDFELFGYSPDYFLQFGQGS